LNAENPLEEVIIVWELGVNSMILSGNAEDAEGSAEGRRGVVVAFGVGCDRVGFLNTEDPELGIVDIGALAEPVPKRTYRIHISGMF
jgi:hypothetical protein